MNKAVSKFEAVFFLFVMRKLKLFITVCLICGLFIIGFSFAGNKLIKTNGTFIGAVIGGLIGIFISSKFAIRFSLANKTNVRSIIGFGTLGFAIAIAISFYNLHHPIIVIMSTSLIGIGAVIGDY